MAERKTTIQDDQSLPVIRKCALLDISRSTLYYTPVEQEPDLEELEIKRLMDELHIKHPLHGITQPSRSIANQGIQNKPQASSKAHE